ncbi:lipoprotein-anchoring transpeptidase ErfK/SrfK [Friedmanniella endophytica]|uniref:Lipoprotein-anchoring transpeptidase ErfK/SrfK n=1 Tax=Microlunatus kandeliicorticis TaxID=1759536 RepID=A0A7W3ISJ3_9ACTN|nr:L,D-transpeptidase [Microlunatus kandeliicorticis]MBA8794454.1 lipoprotein-anchoring transpeptidase ErfK/SrfK [Microlunatus kandeliicorticis]
MTIGRRRAGARARAATLAVAALTATALASLTGCGPSASGSVAGGAPTGTGTQSSSGSSSASSSASSSSAKPSSSAKASSTPAAKPSYPSGPPMLLDSIVPTDGSTVGVAMPIVVVFSDPVKSAARKAIEQAMHLTSTKTVTGAWHWLSSQQVDFRPEGYWPSGSKVTLDARFDHVGDGYGRYGTHSYTRHFTIGNDFETKISASHHTTKVYSDGKLIRSMSSDAGSPQFPSWTGTMSVVSLTRNEHMTSCSAGITCDKNSPNYYDGYYPWAVRLTYSGTFVHYSSADPYPGHSYGSHGCVHLSWSNAEWYFDHVSVGDPVTITGSPRGEADPTNGYAVYNVSWHDWQQHSGLGAITVS